MQGNRVLFLILVLGSVSLLCGQNTALQLDGIDDYIETNITDLSGDAITIEFWFKGSSTQSAVRHQQTGTHYIVSCWSDKHILSNDQGTPGGLLQGAAAEDGTWHHIAMTWQRNTTNGFRTYLDAQLVQQRDTGLTPLPDIGANLIFGSYRGETEFTNGIIDEVRIWDYARTQSQLQDNLIADIPGTEPGLVCRWPFNEGNGPQTFDIVSGSVGTLHNMNAASWVVADYDNIGISSRYPADNATDVDRQCNLGITFNDSVYAGAGSIHLYRSLDDTLIESVPAAQAIINSNVVIVDLATTPVWSTAYYVLVDSDAFYNRNNIYFAGIDDPTAWNFTIEPFLVYVTPADNATQVPGGQSFHMLFAEPVYPGSGNFELYHAENDSLWDSIPVEDVTIENTVVTFTFDIPIQTGEDFYILIDDGALNDGTGYDFPGFSDPEDWNFSGIWLLSAHDIGLSSVACRSIEWGDYDNDGDMDILGTSGSNWWIRRNDGNHNFTVTVSTPVGETGIACFADIDANGLLDVVVARMAGDSPPNGIQAYLNWSADMFQPVLLSPLPGGDNTSLTFADYDRDGDLDILATDAISVLNDPAGQGIPSQTVLYRNDQSDGFVESGALFPESISGTSDWCDYDSDGYPDILLSWKDPSDNKATCIFRNPGTAVDGVWQFDQIVQLNTSYHCSVQWGDYNCDGETDILLGSQQGTFDTALIYRNEGGGAFTSIGSLTVMQAGINIARWCDFDNDGDLDFASPGSYGSSVFGLLYENLGENGWDQYTTSCDWAYSHNNRVTCADCDNDGDMDLLVTGILAVTMPSYPYPEDQTWLNINHNNLPNDAPEPPGLLTSSFDGNTLQLDWNEGTDDRTPAPGLTYNLRIWNEAWGHEYLPPVADTATGYLYKPEFGRFGHGNQFSWPGHFDKPHFLRPDHWAVQSVDNGCTGSIFAADTLNLGDPDFLTLSNPPLMSPQDYLLWEATEEAGGYLIGVSESEDFSPVLFEQYIANPSRSTQRPGFNGVTLDSLSEFSQLLDDQTYYWAIRPIYTMTTPTVYNQEPGQFVFNTQNTLPQPPVLGIYPADDGVVSTTTPMIGWNAADDPDDAQENLHYRCVVDDSISFASPHADLITAPGITFTTVTPPITRGNRYWFRLQTIDDDGAASAWSDTISFIALGPPQNVTITRQDDQTILQWDAVPSGERNLTYTVYSATRPDALFPDEWAVEAVNLSQTQWTDTQTDGDRKFYRVTAGSWNVTRRSMLLRN